ASAQSCPTRRASDLGLPGKRSKSGVGGCTAVLIYRNRCCRFATEVFICHIPPPVANPSESVQCRPLEVQVGDKGIERAIKHLKRDRKSTRLNSSHLI